MKIGFLVNPIAGMGGAVGLKGTDGLAKEAKELGAEPCAPRRAQEFLASFEGDVAFLAASEPMGAGSLSGMEHTVVYECSGETTSQDTIAAARAMREAGAKLIVFAGGDGTARDMLAAVGEDVPVLGIPAGVKMHSGVFAVNPRAAASLAAGYARGEFGEHEAEVMDVDEQEYRAGRMSTSLYGMMLTPYEPALVQVGKQLTFPGDDAGAKADIAAFAAEFMSDGSSYIVGAGSTTKAIADAAGAEKTVLGVDVIKDGKTVLADANERELLEYIAGVESLKIIVTPIGAQGFIFGRGTQQMSPKVIRAVGVKNIIIVATPAKLNSTRYLLSDTGDEALDAEIAGYRSVVMGYRIAQKKTVKAGLISPT